MEGWSTLESSPEAWPAAEKKDNWKIRKSARRRPTENH